MSWNATIVGGPMCGETIAVSESVVLLHEQIRLYEFAEVGVDTLPPLRACAPARYYLARGDDGQHFYVREPSR